MNTLSFSHRRRQRTLCILGVGMLLATVGLSGAQTPTIVVPTTPVCVDLTGHWSGCWDDCRSGHNGKLWADFCKCDDCHYRVTFTGRFFKVFPFRYSVVLNAQQVGDRVVLSGQSDLGLLFGTFSYQGEATATNMIVNYCSGRYQGKFVLSRCCQ